MKNKSKWTSRKNTRYTSSVRDLCLSRSIIAELLILCQVWDKRKRKEMVKRRNRLFSWNRWIHHYIPEVNGNDHLTYVVIDFILKQYNLFRKPNCKKSNTVQKVCAVSPSSFITYELWYENSTRRIWSYVVGETSNYHWTTSIILTKRPYFNQNKTHLVMFALVKQHNKLYTMFLFLRWNELML